MTLGPDRRTLARWLSEPLFQSDSGAPSGATATEENPAETKPEPEAVTTATNEEKPKGDSDAEALILEQGGKRYVLQSHVDTIAAKARSEGRDAGKTEVQTEAERKKAEEDGNWKKLYEDEKTAREAAEADKRTLELSALKSKVGAANGLPPEISNLLTGDDEAALTAHAKELAKVLPKTEEKPKPKAPKTEAGAGAKVRGTDDDSGDGNSSAARRDTGKRFAFQNPGDVPW